MSEQSYILKLLIIVINEKMIINEVPGNDSSFAGLATVSSTVPVFLLAQSTYFNYY